MRYVLLLWILILPFCILPAQNELQYEISGESQETEIQKNLIFPVVLLLNNAEFTETGFWQPDWPPEFPPDAFRLNNPGWISIRVYDGKNIYSVRRVGDLLLEFPVYFEGEFSQVRFEYYHLENNFPENTDSRLKWVFLDNSISMEILEYDNGAPFLLRIHRSGIFYFVYIQYRGLNCFESWYDRDGNFLEQFTYNYFSGTGRIRNINALAMNHTENRSYDSRFLTTEIKIETFDHTGSVYSVSYFQENLPRYWRRDISGMDAGHYTLQWDENGMLVRVLGVTDELRSDSRYEYSLDEKGNWIGRQEIRMFPNTGVLIPAQAASFFREVEYIRDHGDAE